MRLVGYFLLGMLWCSVNPAEGRAGVKDTVLNKGATQVAPDSVRKMKGRIESLGGAVQKQPEFEPDFVNTFVYDFFTTANAVQVENAQTSDQKDELNFYYNITLNNTLKTKIFTLRSYLYNEYGVRHFPDSVTIKGVDDYTIRNTLQVPIGKRIRFQCGAAVKSQIWKTRNYRKIDTSQTVERYLYADYFSPGYITYSFGVSAAFLGSVVLDIGLVGGKIVKMKNQDVYEQRKTDKLYGLEKGHRRTASYGISLVLNTPPKALTKNFWWECTGNLFVPKDQVWRTKGYTLDAMNVFHYIFFENMRISLRTQVKYDEQINKKVFMMNTISVGFYLSNKL